MTLACRGVRGATTAEANTREAILDATRELLERVIEANLIEASQVAAIFFTTTPDLNAEFPAVAARAMGWNNTALLCSHEMSVPDGLPGCIRVLILVNTEKQPQELVHVYLKQATTLRARGLET